MHDCEMGLIAISVCEWPRFLYPQDTKCDLEDDLAGLFRGYLLPIVRLFIKYMQKCLFIYFSQVFQQIFTGPRTAIDPGAPRKGRTSKSHLHNMTEVTGRQIAYVCVIVSLILCLS